MKPDGYMTCDVNSVRYTIPLDYAALLTYASKPHWNQHFRAKEGQGMNPIAKLFIIGGIVLIIVGLLWQFGGRFLPFGRLPGDITVEKENFKFYFPLTTSIIVSIVLSLIFYLLQRGK